MVQEIFGGAFPSIEAALNVRAVRQEMLAANIANAETPGYRALDVDFDSTMQSLLGRDERGEPLAIPRPSPSLAEALRVVGDDAPSIGFSQNTVSVDEQMAHLEENALHFQIASQLALTRFQSLKSIIDEGGRNR